MRGTRSGAGFEHPELLCYFIECLIGQSSGNATIDMRGMIWDNIVGNRGQKSLQRFQVMVTLHNSGLESHKPGMTDLEHLQLFIKLLHKASLVQCVHKLCSKTITGRAIEKQFQPSVGATTDVVEPCH